MTNLRKKSHKKSRKKSRSSARASQIRTRYLPEELIVEILRRLPVKSLLRFKSVCRSWYFIISSPNFSYLHRKQHRLLLYSSISMDLRSIDSIAKDAAVMPLRCEWEVRCPGHHNLEILGTCNGLICLGHKPYNNMDDHDLLKNIYIWNPSTRGLKGLQETREIEDGGYTMSVAVGYDRRIDDHKVVRLILSFKSLRCRQYAEVSTLGSMTRRKIFYFDSDSNLMWPDTKWVFVNGVLYWQDLGLFAYNNKRCVIGFDLAEESFRKLMLPDLFCDSNISTRIDLVVIEGCLGVYGRSKEEKFEVWILKHDDGKMLWSRLATIQTEEGMWLAPIWFSSEREFVGLSGTNLFGELVEGMKLISFNIRENSFKCLVEEFSSESLFYNVAHYEETLVSVR